MADNKLALDLEVKGVEQSISSIKDLKNAIKDARNEQIKAGEQFGISSKQYEDAAKKVSALKDKVEDLGDSTKSLQGSGIERASQGFNQLGEGLRNLDFDKVKVGLTAIKSALAATGIMLVVQGFTYLVENFDELSKGSGILAKTLQTVGSILGGIKEALYNVSDAIGATNHQLDLMGDRIAENVKKSKESLDSQVKGYDRQVELLKALGKETTEIELEKQRQIIFTNTILIKQYEGYVRKGRQLNEEEKKQLTEALESNKDAWNQMKLIEINNINAQKTANKDANTTKLADNKKYLEDKQKDENEAFIKYLQQKIDNDNLLAELDAKKLADEKASKDAWMEEAKSDSDDNLAYNVTNQNIEQGIKDANRQAELEAFKSNYAAQLQIAQQTTNSLQALSDAYFFFKTKNLQKGSEAELKAAHQQFKINKALSITSAVISGIQGVVNALSAQSVIPEPFGSILKGVTAAGVGIAAAVNVAKISAMQFNPGSTPSGGGAQTSIPVPAAPTINTPQANTNSSTTFDETGKKIGGENNTTPTIKVNATVGVNEIAEKSNRVNVLESQSKF